jgi:hypothetical protein
MTRFVIAASILAAEIDRIIPFNVLSHGTTKASGAKSRPWRSPTPSIGKIRLYIWHKCE